MMLLLNLLGIGFFFLALLFGSVMIGLQRLLGGAYVSEPPARPAR